MALRHREKKKSLGNHFQESRSRELESLGHPQSHLGERDKRTWLSEEENEAVGPSYLRVQGLRIFCETLKEK